jgi:hypothetical protein
MGWDSSRPVPWRRLVREWVVYAAIMSVVFLVFFRGDSMVGAVAGVLISGPLYLAFGAVMAKFGYQRQQLRRPSKADPSSDATSASSSGSSAPGGTAGPRPKPAPTSRTGGRPASSSKRRR